MADQVKRSRARNHTGSVLWREERKKWQAQISAPLGKRLSKSFKTQGEAEKWLRETQRQIEAGLGIAAAAQRVHDAFVNWLEKHKNAWRPKTYQQYEHVIMKYILHFLPHRLRVIEMKPFHVRGLLQVAEGNGVGIRIPA